MFIKNLIIIVRCSLLDLSHAPMFCLLPLVFSYVSLKWANFYFSSPKFTDSFLHNLKSTVSSAFSMPIAVVSISKLTFLGCGISIFH